MDGYSCYSYEISDFIPVDAGVDRACRGENAADDSLSYKTLLTVSSLAECKQHCRANATCTGTMGIKTVECQHALRLGPHALVFLPGIEFINTRCEVWTQEIQATVAASGFQCLKLLRLS